ncbi:ABC transporter substrate-binding protein [Thermoplasma sp.]|uniref:ABC transporter substrate-binding protein n=1 Tax=Thermoplasma sp. TaxID=1973142 RepID=UPI001277E03F|nr:ABC transporter substrate-binding protein [Thermoplasma sp.]KAA8921992.1 MAG: hypothetical protein F6Q11_06620 [Thermoplasma sp.]
MESNQPNIPPVGPKASNTKWYAIITVLVVIIVVVSVLGFYHPVTIGSSSKVTSAVSTATIGQPYNITIQTNGKFNNLTIYWGDGTTTTVAYSGSDTVTVSHVYNNAGNYYIYYTVNFGSSVYTNLESLVSVVAAAPLLPQNESLATVALISSSTSPLVNQTQIFPIGTSLSYLIGYYTLPTNPAFSIVSQVAYVYRNGSLIDQVVMPYYYNFTDQAYKLPPSQAYLNLTHLGAGYYEIAVATYTAAILNYSSGLINATAGLFHTTFYQDIVIASSAALYVVPSVVTTFVNAEAETGAYKTLDGAIAYDTVSGEILENVYQFLVMYKGSSSSSFVPELASQLPSTTNGGINTNYANYTVTTPWHTTYTVHITPYENYTFHIRSNATWQNGQPVTAWDVYYSYIRTLLFDAGSPETPGWIIAQVLLPGNYYESNTFWNITQNMTVNNATNSITFHFQRPLTPNFVFELFSASGDFVMDANWIVSHATAAQPALAWKSGLTPYSLPWNATGFNEYKAQGSASDYNEYLVNNVMADGPYEIDYIIPSSAVVLVKNPDFNPPGPWFPRAHIDKIVLEYIGETSTRYLQMKSGYAQAGGIPSSDWSLVEGLNASHIEYYLSKPSLSIFWYDFNANVNTTMLSTLDKSANMPSALFSVLQIRKAFAYAYNESQYLNTDVGNAIYHVTFAVPYAGMLDAGMLGYQSIAELNATTNGQVPYFNLALAKMYWQEGVKTWNNLVNSNGNSKYDITVAPDGDYEYMGAPLNIPIIIFSADPVDLAGATQWGGYLSSFITGATFPVIPLAFPSILGYQVQGQNPMPIYELGWAPDYPYPTDYLGPMALPENSTTYPGPNDMTPYWIGYNTSNPARNATEAYYLQLMIGYYDNGTAAANTSVALMWFHKMNEELINMTFYVYIEQAVDFQIMSYKVPQSVMIQWEQNVMWTIGAGDLLYNYLYYT